VDSPRDYQVELLGPASTSGHWQFQANQGYTLDDFEIDWDAKTVTCPQGHTTSYWKPTCDAHGREVMCLRFSRPGCRQCEVRSLCTRAEKESRSLTLRATKAQHQALRDAHRRQQTPEWKALYAQRAGIEGTFSQGIRAFGLRHARYIGCAKTHLQHLLTAAAINLVRVDAWVTDTPLAKTRISRFLALQPLAA
jgi:transposase